MKSVTVSHYIRPQRWLRYDATAIFEPLVQAKTAAGVLSRMPSLPQWIEQVHEEQLRLEAAGTRLGCTEAFYSRRSRFRNSLR